MSVTSLRRWHWMVIGLLAGALYGRVRESSSNFYDELSAYGPRRIGQREFEAAVTTRFHGKARFSDLSVRPYALPASGGPAVTVHVVSGLYWDGKTQTEGGRVAARWEPAYFVASAPFVRHTRTSATTAPASAAVAPDRFDDVMAYLRSSPAGEPVPFEYVSWWWVTRPQVAWTLAGVVLIGGVWPTIVNLLAFGTFLRPKRAQGLSLWPAKSTAPEGGKVPVEWDPDVAAALARGLTEDPAAAPAEPPPAVPAAAAIRVLHGDAEPAAAAVADERGKDFGKAEEDFYPTELRAQHGA